MLVALQVPMHPADQWPPPRPVVRDPRDATLGLLRARVELALARTAREAELALATVAHDPAAARAHAGALIDAVRWMMAEARVVVTRLAGPGGAATAGDVHDVLGHGLSLAAVLAGGAHAVLPCDPVRARTLLARAADALAQAQAEVDALFLERGTPPPGRDVLDLALLVGHAIDAGEDVVLDADWTAVGEAGLPVLDAAHRFLQEALTNARKHAAGARVTVRVWVSRDRLRLDVTSARGGTVRSGCTGLGLAVMRRRAQALGGRVVFVPAPTTFTVRASLPLLGPTEGRG